MFVLLCVLTLCALTEATCPAPNTHCDCSNVRAAEITCVSLTQFPGGLYSNTTALNLDRNFIGPLLIKQQIGRLANLSLTELILSKNQIVALEDGCFDSLYLLQTLDLSDNPIQALSDLSFRGLKKLKYLFMSNTKMAALPTRAFESLPMLIELDLEDGLLREIGIEFVSLRRLATLMLARNKINQIDRAAFSGLGSLTHLSLFGNKLQIPQSAWFRDLVRNNGTLELDRRFNGATVYPNPWLCCPQAAIYYHYLSQQSRNLRSYDQLNIVCSWPVHLSGRLLSSLSEIELNLVPCANFTTSTTTLPFTTTTTTTTSATESRVPVIVVRSSNFMGRLNDAGAAFILILVAVLAAIVVAFVYWKRGSGKQSSCGGFPTLAVHRSSESVNSEMKITSRPYKQDAPAYGATFDNKDRNEYEEASTEGTRKFYQTGNGYSSVVSPAYPHLAETDQSEDEIWNSEKRKPL